MLWEGTENWPSLLEIRAQKSATSPAGRLHPSALTFADKWIIWHQIVQPLDFWIRLYRYLTT